MKTSVVVITGASSGIGAQMAQTFSRKGYSLLLLARNLEAMEAFRLPNARAYSLDVTDSSAFKEIISKTEREFGQVSCLINSAGALIAGEFAETHPNEEAAMVNVNLMGVMNGIHAVLPGMKERKQGTIINISSLSDRNSRPLYAAYAASKAAVKSLTESLRAGYAKSGIRICNLAPGPVNTAMQSITKVEGKPTISPEDLANTALWMFEQPNHVCIRDLVIAPTTYEP